MDKLVTLESVAAPLLDDNIDTDIIFPARFLLLLDRKGLGQHAFADRRGKQQELFILDTPAYDGASILVCGRHFGTGSSREQAVWALADLGIRCILARSLGEIFQANCLKNGVLALALDDGSMDRIEAAAMACEIITVDLPKRTIDLVSGSEIVFHISDAHCETLMSGLDDIDRMLLEDLVAIDSYEAEQARHAPWIEIPEAQFIRLDEETGHHE